MYSNKVIAQSTKKKKSEWFENGYWRKGLNPEPDASIDVDLFYEQYFQNKEIWDLAFDFFKNEDLASLDTGKYFLKNDSLIVIVDEYKTKDMDETKFEAHEKYIDIQYLIKGEEKIGVTKLKNQKALIPYDETKDIAFYDISGNNYRLANEDVFFIFFPEDAHRPCIKTGPNATVKKIVFKIISGS